jgi:hypothetical protein
VVLSGDAAVEGRLRELPGVLETAVGQVGGGAAPRVAVRVVFDPVKVSYSTVLEQWSRATASDRVVYGPSPEEKLLAKAMSERTATQLALLDPAPPFTK